MQGKQDHQPELFSTLNLETIVPETHLLRKYERVLDLSFVHAKTESLYCLSNGRPSVDPEVFMRMMLLSHIYGIHSDRQLCEEIHCNLAYRWFCKFKIEDEIPDHSSLTRIRDRLVEATFKELFEQIVAQCRKANLVSGKRVMADGSLIDANASLYSLVKRGEEKKPENANSTRRKSKWILGAKISNKTHLSATDPEARIAGKAWEKKRLLYKDHRIIDADSRVILDAHITDGAKMEGNVFIDRLKKVEGTFEIRPDEIIADRGYGYGENLKSLIDDERGVFIPRMHKTASDKLQGFTFDEKANEFICQAGERLTPQSISKAGMQAYRAPNDVCNNCPFMDQCKIRKIKGHRYRLMTVNIHHAYHAIIRSKERTEEFKGRMRESMWKVEGLFAEAKEHHGLRRAKYRGRAKMQIQAYVIACVQNLKRMMGGAGSALWDFISDLLRLVEMRFFLKIILK